MNISFIKNKIKRVMIFSLFGITTACGSGGSSGSTVPTVPAPLATGNFSKYTGNPSSTLTSGLITTSSTVRVQSMYEASEIKAVGNITALKFVYQLDETTAITCPNITIKMGHTKLTALTDTFASNVEQGAGTYETVLADGSITFPTGLQGDQFTITLDTPFNYNGMDNLVVDLVRSSACDGTFNELVTSVTPLSAVYTGVLASPTGTTAAWHANLEFDFAGGDNQQNYGTGADDTSPFNSTTTPKIQTLYKAADINGSGPITAIGFQMNATSIAGDYTYTVRMGHTSLTTLTHPSNFSDNYNVDGVTTVANAQTFSIPAGIITGDWFWLPIPEGSFNYNGTDNLLVEIEAPVASAINILKGTSIDIGIHPVEIGLRLYSGVADATTSQSASTLINHMKFRFNGSPIQVMPSGNSGSRQVLGGQGSTGAGQLQSLYVPAFVGTGGTISSISVRLRTDSVAATIPNYKIYMGNTNKTTFSLADSYSSNMELNQTLVFSGSFDIPAGLKAGDWVNIPLHTNFVYDSTKNMSILFMANSASPDNNDISGSVDTTLFSSHSVGRGDNTVDITGTPVWDWNGIVDVRLNITK